MANPTSSIKAIEDCLNDAKALEKSYQNIFIEACVEVEAAEGREEGATKDVHLEVARKFEKLAKSAFFQARKSVKDAEARHKAASEHIINVDSDEDDESVDDGDKKPAAIPAVASLQGAATSAGSNKRAAASSSQTGAQSKRLSVQSTSERMMNESHHTTNNEQAEGTNTEVQNSATSDPGHSFSLAREIEITGCGTPEANGTYISEGSWRNRAPQSGC